MSTPILFLAQTHQHCLGALLLSSLLQLGQPSASAAGCVAQPFNLPELAVNWIFTRPGYYRVALQANGVIARWRNNDCTGRLKESACLPVAGALSSAPTPGSGTETPIRPACAANAQAGR